MTNVLARKGAQFELRASASVIWAAGTKRKRGEPWVCRTCRVHGASGTKGVRLYSDATLRLPGVQWAGSSVFERRDGGEQWTREVEIQEEGVPQESASLGRGPWSRTRRRADEGKAEETTVGHDVSTSDMLSGRQVSRESDAVPTVHVNAHSGESSDAGALTVVGPRFNSELLDIDYAESLQPALQQRNVDLVARCLYSAYRAGDLTFIKRIPQQMYSEILEIIRPDLTVGRLLVAHTHVSEDAARRMRVVPAGEIARDYGRLISDVYAMRRNAGVELAMEDYKTLLRSSSILGQKALGLLFWKRLYDAGHLPDVECYNYYMGSVVWAGRHHSKARHSVRVIPFHQKARQQDVLGKAYRNYRIGSGGLQEDATNIFNRMLNRGVVANEESFRILMTAAAREGDLSTVKIVLRRVWNIDVDALINGDEPSPDTLRHVSKEASLHPSTDLMYAVAHAWGINNDISTALRLVDYIARSYDLPVSTDVWSQLFEWTYVLAASRSGAKSASDGSKSGELPAQSLTSLWQTMTSAPYYAQPSIAMYNHYIKNLAERRSMTLLVQTLEAGRKLDVQQDAILHQMRERLDNAVNDSVGLRAVRESRCTVQTKDLELRADYDYLTLLRGRNNIWLQRWFRLLLSPTRYWARANGFSDSDASVNTEDEDFVQTNNFAYRVLPHMLWTWRQFAPTFVTYQIPGGQVEFRLRTKEKVDEGVRKRQKQQLLQTRIRERIPRIIGDHWSDNGATTYRIMRMALAQKFERTLPGVNSHSEG